MRSQKDTNQIFLHLNRGLQALINDALISGKYPEDMKALMTKTCHDIINERNIELQTHIVTLIENRIKQYMKLYNLKVRYAK